MFLKVLHRLHVPSDVAYGLAVASILGSIVVWARRNEKDPANAERLGIFIGLWAPTFMIIGNGLHVEEAQSPQFQNETEALAGEARDVAQSVGV